MLLSWLLIPFVTAAVMPSKEWLAGYAAVGIIAFLAIYLESSDSQGGSPGLALGLLFIGMAMIGFVAGIIARSIGLAFAAFGAGYVLRQIPVVFAAASLLGVYYVVLHHAS